MQSNNNTDDTSTSCSTQNAAAALFDSTGASSGPADADTNATVAETLNNDAAVEGHAPNAPAGNDNVVVGRHDAVTPSSSDTDDGGDEDDPEAISTSKHAIDGLTLPSSPSSSLSSASPASSDALSSAASRKRPLELSTAALIKQQQQQVRKRRYVDSSHTVDGVRKHVTVACARVDTGGFKCTFTLEHRRLEGTLNQQRANAKGGDIIERRHDVFMIQDSQGDDAPFPDYDRVYDNFLRRGIDICDHVRSELVPIRATPKESSSADDSTGVSDAAV